MKIHLNKIHRAQIIDRTLPELINSSTSLSKNHILEFCILLRKAGVGFIEIDNTVLEKLGNDFSTKGFLYRINSRKDVELCLKFGFSRCVLDGLVAKDLSVVERISKVGIDITVEFGIGSETKLYNLTSSIDKSIMKMARNIRLTGMDWMLSSEWCSALQRIRKELHIKIDICPTNRYDCATALCIEGMMQGVDAVTAAFTGYGAEAGYTPIEEVLLSAKLLLGSLWPMDLSVLQKLKFLFERFTGEIVHPDKPVIGKDIFKYESGVHADGIQKDPSTYEPYNPAMVGLQRSMHIGKHSGKGAISIKLRELGIPEDNMDVSELLIIIRQKSIKLGRGLCDEELKEVCGGLL